jgi:hypothetical protein
MNMSPVTKSGRGQPPPRKPPLTVAQILTWADEYHAAHGRWPRALSGRVAGAPEENWKNIDALLRHGQRGLPRGSSLRRLLDEHRPGRREALTVEMILSWADAHRAATSQWPTYGTGRVVHAPFEETWHGINLALRRGWRGLPGGQCLAWLLQEHRQVKPRVSREGHLAQMTVRRRLSAERPGGRRNLTVEQILLWADQHHATTGAWPKARSAEPIPGAPGETWSTLNAALTNGRRGLPGGSSLSGLMLEHRGPATPDRIPELSFVHVLAGADASAPGDPTAEE